MSSTAPNLIWFRNDLRLHDNPALTAAYEAGGPVIALYILDEAAEGVRPLGAASKWWLHHSLIALGRDLRDIGIPLVLHKGAAAEVIAGLVKRENIARVYWNRRYGRAGIACDTAIKSALAEQGVEAQSYSGCVLNEPFRILTGQQTPYRVFTPYWRTARESIGDVVVLPKPGNVKDAPSASIRSDAIGDWDLLPKAPDWAGGLRNTWTPGEAGARERLADFLDHPLRGYAEHRDIPSHDHTSGLSAHLRFGEISPQTVWRAVSLAAGRDETLHDDAEKFLAEIGWREFSIYLVFHFPEMETQNFNPTFDRFSWRTDDEQLLAWQQGRTGYPIVDAGMRELWETGTMHNRVRMITASFLTKHLRLHWRIGEAWFWDTLVDADPASNVSNWQWVAGTGADAAPYFRIFNPMLQGEKFDTNGAYVRRWVPELSNLPDKFVHQPWKAPRDVLDDAGIDLGRTYPHPIVEHVQARATALDAFRSLKDA